mgnify:CR=1 FL=1
MTDKVAITCALTGVLTDPKQHPVPVTIEQMATAAKEAFDAGASIMHVHFRRQEAGQHEGAAGQEIAAAFDAHGKAPWWAALPCHVGISPTSGFV